MADSVRPITGQCLTVAETVKRVEADGAKETKGNPPGEWAFLPMFRALDEGRKCAQGAQAVAWSQFVEETKTYKAFSSSFDAYIQYGKLAEGYQQETDRRWAIERERAVQ